MSRLILSLVAAGAVCWAPAQAQDSGARQDRREAGAPSGRPGGPRSRDGYANPSKAIAADIGLNRLSREKGQWTALLESAAPTAEMFTPQRVSAQVWLKRRPNPASPASRRPQSVWASCDGSIAVTTGSWQQTGPDGAPVVSDYVTVWETLRKGDLRWLATMRLTAADAQNQDDMLTARVSECQGAPLSDQSTVDAAAGADVKSGNSRDQSLRWTTTVAADGSRRFILTVREGGAERNVLDRTAPAEWGE